MLNMLLFTAGYKAALEVEANELAEAPGGSALTDLVGKVYENEAKQHMMRWFGLQKVFSELKEKGTRMSNMFGVIRYCMEEASVVLVLDFIYLDLKSRA
jgi:hypothetical protein